jgi:hypothetical protein
MEQTYKKHQSIGRKSQTLQHHLFDTETGNSASSVLRNYRSLQPSLPRLNVPFDVRSRRELFFKDAAYVS